MMPQTESRFAFSALPQRLEYAMVPSGEAIDADDVEEVGVASIEVVTVWGSNVLHVEHLTPPRSYFVGEEDSPVEGRCDFLLPSEVLGVGRAPVVVVDELGARVVVLQGATGSLEVAGGRRVDLKALVAAGRGRPSATLRGAFEVELPAGAKARLQMAGSQIAFEVSAVCAGKPVAAGLFAQLEKEAYSYFGLSLIAHIGILASLAFFMPHTSFDDVEAIDRDTIPAIRHLLDAQAERELELANQPADHQGDKVDVGGQTGGRSRGEEGTAGSPLARETGHHFGVQRHDDSQDTHLAVQAALNEARWFGVIGLLNTGSGGDPHAPTSPWGREDSNGADPMSALGNMWGDAIGDALGNGGLGISGAGEGGGGRSTGVGLLDDGSIGRSLRVGQDEGIGRSHGHLDGSRMKHFKPIRETTIETNGRLPREVIQRIVRQNFGRFRLCYEDGLRTNPALAGRVAVKFAIDRNGAVATAQDGGSDLPNQAVVSCVVRGFMNLSFPPPQDGIVSVVYPILLGGAD